MSSAYSYILQIITLLLKKYSTRALRISIYNFCTRSLIIINAVFIETIPQLLIMTE